MLVFMRLSKKFSVPGDLALLYDFVNSLDLRRYREKGARHAPADELETVARLEAWLDARGLLDGKKLDKAEHRRALELREALRAFLQGAPADRRGAVVARLDASAACYPLAVAVSEAGTIGLRPRRGPSSGGLARVLAELLRLSETGRLDRLKMCASDQCRWIFFDRSKPTNRRWCSSALCGNREKTRTYRRRRRETVDSESRGPAPRIE
jgi:predicted RNA-binding Zn ribbon-like protein